MQEGQNGSAQGPLEAKPSRSPKWERTNYSKLVRYAPSGTYFARIRSGGKLYRKSLGTAALSVARMRLADLESELLTKSKAAAARGGRMTLGQAMAFYLEEIDSNPKAKPSLKKYRHELIVMMKRTWPEGIDREVSKLGERDCILWSNRWRSYSANRVNNAIGTLREVFNIAIREGSIYANPAANLNRERVVGKTLILPEPEQFPRLVEELENAGGRFSRDCSDLVRFLAYGGFREGEAANITWADCDFKAGQIFVRGDAEVGAKNRESRYVPMTREMKSLLKGLRAERATEPPEALVMRVQECQKALDAAARDSTASRADRFSQRNDTGASGARASSGAVRFARIQESTSPPGSPPPAPPHFRDRESRPASGGST